MSSAARGRSLSADWYPATAEACLAQLTPLRPAPGALPGAFAAIVPHAGWRYSLPLWGPALAALAAARPRADLVVLFAGHTEKPDPPRLFVEGQLSTPLGPIRIAEKLSQDLAMALPEPDLETPEEHYEDYGVEVLLPAIRHYWPEAPLVLIGPPPTVLAIEIGKEVAKLAQVHRASAPVLIGSTDLTHYGRDHGYRPRGAGAAAHAWVKRDNDGPLLAAALKLDAAELIWVAERQRSACSAGAAAATIAAAKRLGAKSATLTAHQTSHEIAGTSAEPESFVSYAAIVLGP